MGYIKPFALSLLCCYISACSRKMQPHYELFIGTYTQKEGHVDGKAEGIYRLFLDAKFKEIAPRQIIGGVTNPSWIKLSGNLLFSAEETTPDGKITSFKIEADKVKKINSVSSKGGAPCHLDCYEGILIAANYVGNNTVSYTYDKDGKLSEAISNIRFEGKGLTARQEASHPHQVVMNEKTAEVHITDLGTDSIYTLTYTQKGELKRSTIKDRWVDAGDGPRHWVGTTNWFVLNELSSTITVFNSSGSDKIQKISTLPAEYRGHNTSAEIVTNGDFIYATNRGHNSIAIFKIAQESGRLSLVGFESTKGDCPRNIALSPDKKYLFCANQNSDNILIFNILENGQLILKKTLDVKTPVCMAFR
jgi:6-phosphogluconolactonase